jgi:quinol monooxygenase YgiN
MNSGLPAGDLEADMNMKQLLIFSASSLASSVGGAAVAQQPHPRYVQIAEIEVDAAELENYKAAVSEHAETAIRVEPGVLVLYAVSARDDPTHVTVFEIYRDIDAYRAHLESAHFKKYKATTEQMVKSLKLVPISPIALASKLN